MPDESSKRKEELIIKKLIVELSMYKEGRKIDRVSIYFEKSCDEKYVNPYLLLLLNNFT